MVAVCGPYFKGWFFGRGREREGDSARVAGRWEEREGEMASFAGHAKQPEVQRVAATPHDRPRLYTGFANPLIRVDSHDRLEGYPPTDPPLLIRPAPFGHPLSPSQPLTHPLDSAVSSTSGALGPHSDSQHAWLTIPGLKMTVFLCAFLAPNSPRCALIRA